jgi:6-phosphofructokinase 1
VLVYASRFGFEGLLGSGAVAPLRIEDVRGILPRGGSILGCSTRSNPFALVALAAGADDSCATAAALRERLNALGIDGLVLVGGDGTMAIGTRLSELGVRCIGIPKTIDGDVAGTEETCGIDSAVQTATLAVDALHSTAEAHQRVMIVEVMGRHAGFIALRSGIAGGADAVLIPEIPYDVGRVAAKIREREAVGLRFSIIVVGEGALPVGGEPSEVEPAHSGLLARLGGAGNRLARELSTCEIAHEIRVTVLGHLQRGGIPTASDRLLASRFGAHAAELCAQGRFGRMVALHAGHVESVAIEEASRSKARVDTNGELVQCARALRIELGAA